MLLERKNDGLFRITYITNLHLQRINSDPKSLLHIQIGINEGQHADNSINIAQPPFSSVIVLRIILQGSLGSN